MMRASWKRTPPVSGAVLAHFASIGIAAADLPRLVDQAIAVATDLHHVVWRDSSGATFYVHLDGDEVLCLTPFFAASAPALWRVRTHAPIFDAECIHCGGADCDVLAADGSMVTRATVQWTEFREAIEWLRVERTFDLAVVVFAHQATFADSPGELAAHRRSALGDLHLAETAFVPVGMLGPSDQVRRRASAIVTGRTEKVTWYVGNAGRSFVHLRMRSVQGIVDVVLDETLGRGAIGGRYAMIDGWLVGRPVRGFPLASGALR
jgi:hypothetical protein